MHISEKFHQTLQPVLRLLFGAPVQFIQQAKCELEDNKAKLRAIVETVVLCGRQDYALKGDKDSGRLSLEEPSQSDGNLRALAILARHIRTAGRNALYGSPHIQNNIISIIGKLTQDEIVIQVNEAGFFSVLADETTDVGQTEQFGRTLRRSYYFKHSGRFPVLRTCL